MPNVALFDIKGQNIGDIALSENVFGQPVNTAVMHEVVVAHLANCRQGTQSAKTRSEVSGGGKKPWRQKGTGRARQGSTRAPQWTHGGVALGPKPRLYKTKMNKKVKAIAMTSALSSKVADGDFIVVDKIETAEYKTKTMVKMLSALEAKKKVLVVLAEKDEKVLGSLANIPGVKVALTNTINVYDILNCDSFIVAKAAAEKIEEVYA
jgi:large subunit ribosomal protein L4